MGERPDPTCDRYGKRWPRLKQTVDTYMREDPPTQPKLAIPITVIHHLLKRSWLRRQNTPSVLLQQAVADLTCIAFYFLLRVGEYTKPRSNSRKLTIPFDVKHVTFRNADGHIIPNTSTFDTLCTAKRVTITIPRSKNGMKGQTITQDCTGTNFSPVQSIAC